VNVCMLWLLQKCNNTVVKERLEDTAKNDDTSILCVDLISSL
jgi:hypothetical protein